MTDHDLTPETLDALDRLLADATPGPWYVDYAGDFGDKSAHIAGVARERYGNNAVSFGEDHATAEFVTALVNAAPALLAAAREDTYWHDQYDRATCECDAALAELAALRERVAALLADGPDSWDGHETRDIGSAFVADLVLDFTADLRAALDVGTASHDGSGERDGGGGA